jgi:nucleoid DNA-binding protein
MGKYGKNDLGLNDLCNLIANEVPSASPKSAKRYLLATYKVILEQLRINKRISIYGFGVFEIFERKSGQRLIPDINDTSKTKLVYIKPRNSIRFKPSQVFDTNVNENNFKLKMSMQNKLKEKKKKSKDFDESIVELMNKAERRSANEWQNK